MPRQTTDGATTKRTTARKVAARRRRTAVTHDHIATRAYFLHLERGGDPFGNWLEAERELATV